MDLILWRHADAEDGWPDQARVLTPKGLRQAELMANWLKPLLPEDVRILVSPAQRTQQTAQALNMPFETSVELATDKMASHVLKAAGWPRGQGTVLVVGHQPTLGQIAALLLAGFSNEWSVKKGGVWWFSQQVDQSVELISVMSPRILSISH